MDSNKKTKDKTVIPYNMPNGYWPKFSHYTIEDIEGKKFICPRSDATFSTYDPWEMQNEDGIECVDKPHSTRNWKRQQPHTILLNLMKDLDIDCFDLTSLKKLLGTRQVDLPDEKYNIICNWCADFGLLGIMSQEVRMFHVPYIKDTADGKIYKYSAHYKNQGQWESAAQTISPVGNLQPEQKISIWPVLDRKTGQVQMEGFQDFSEITALESSYWKFPGNIADNFFPFSDNVLEIWTGDASEMFWRNYCEPLDFFLDRAATLCRGLINLSRIDSGDLFEDGVERLNKLISEVPISYSLVNGELKPQFRISSLMSTFALLALKDAEGAGQLRVCKNNKCRRWFTSKDIRVKFCQDACNKAHSQAEFRRREKEKAEAEKNSNRVCPECGGSMEGKRPQAKFCTVTCGDTYRKRENRGGSRREK